MTSSSSSCELINEEPERRSLKPLTTKTTKKSNYGSLRTEIQQTTTQIINHKHKLKQGETLQGISLKYSVPIETIKRANKLWSNDLAFIKDFLIVPIEKTRINEFNIDENEIIDNEQVNVKIDSQNEQNAHFKDYLNKFDSVISESKLKLKTLESNPNLNGTKLKYSNSFVKDEFLDSNNKKQNLKKTSTIDTSYTSTCSSMSDHSQAAEVMITSPNNYSNFYSSNHNLIKTSSSSLSRARLAQENLQRLEKEKDDLFEL
ncbi:unnamed protein product [Brachionus calyciflorus]|uniref:LysM domain-containing protein n=1 Tax=Brachionus calyciflorus TaxID=104777 RepID=A0A813M8N9_9BILA|nr:unnamed protein product [Brachionus calyciflorus]